MDWEPAYACPCVTATVTAILEDGRKLTAAVRAYSELNIYIDTVFTDFEKQYITPSMTEKEKAEKAAWYISTTSDYELYNKALHEASKAFSKGSGMSKRCWKLYDILEDEWTKYNILYGDEAYRLGFEDGVQVASERKIRANGSVLSVMDMTHLIYLYDAIRKLNKLLLGE